MFRLALQLSLLGLAAANIQLTSFEGTECDQFGARAVQNVSPNPGADFQSSGCQTAGSFGSVKISSIDPGFVCNIYADFACQQFLLTVSEQICQPVIGQGIICFAQVLFENPLALTTAFVTIGTQSIAVSQGSFDEPKGFDRIIRNAAADLCAQGNACDGGRTFTKEFSSNTCVNNLSALGGTFIGCTKTCKQILTLEGTFADSNSRDYMVSILASAVQTALTPADSKKIVSPEMDDLVSVPNFATVEIRNPDTSIKGSMTLKVGIDCKNELRGDLGCDTGGISSVLGKLPGVGGFLSGGYSVTCALLPQ